MPILSQEPCVIANIGSSKQGKSETIKMVFDLLKNKSTNVNIIKNGADIKATLVINGHLIGIESQGDPNPRMPQSMTDFRNLGCKIILTACRTAGYTHQAVIDLQIIHGYRLISVRNPRSYQGALGQPIMSNLNAHYAEWLAKFIEDIALGKI